MGSTLRFRGTRANGAFFSRCKPSFFAILHTENVEQLHFAAISFTGKPDLYSSTICAQFTLLTLSRFSLKIPASRIAVRSLWLCLRPKVFLIYSQLSPARYISAAP